MEVPHNRLNGTHLHACVAEVGRVWNDADSINKWRGQNGYTALVVRNDVREGGSYLPRKEIELWLEITQTIVDQLRGARDAVRKSGMEKGVALS